MPVGPAVLLASERAAAHLGGSSRRSAHGDPRRCGAQMMITASRCMLRTSLPPAAGETEANAGDRVAPQADSPSLSLSLPPSLPLSLPLLPFLSSNATLVIYAQVPPPQTRIS